MGVDWGSVPDWLAGGGAVFALFFASMAVQENRKTNRAQAKQLEQLERDLESREQERRAEQAANVAVWVSTEAVEGVDRAAIRLVNSSSLPVYNMLLSCSTPVGDVEKAYAAIGPRSDRRIMTRITKDLRALLEFSDFSEMHDRGEVLVGCSFRDAAGLWWYRTRAGGLSRADGRAEAEAGARTP